MSKFKLKKNELKVFETEVLMKSCVKLTLTNQRIVFEKEQGIFKKKLKVIKIISYENIKVNNNKVSINQIKKMVEIKTIDGNISFNCANVLEAKKIVNKIIELKTGTSFLEKCKNNVDKIGKIANDGGVIVGIATPLIGFLMKKDK